ncbi:hypothetical protein MY04_1055 [Flammeovirga sp. MY04]|uniref:hypothetical protein n=1 Tax=Flammeovirga sp. MY04 TaxID=1191459 RepID=UPI00080617BF|nr:hypothetical protein [Flammeovirga sp. MY04]ANQ48433.1 hypothetical protein MY04_1055 [Flammeovirga sp. MY04]
MNILFNILLTPIYIFLIYFIIAPYFANKWTNKYTRKYFWWGLTTKMFGAISFCCIYQFYYGNGDTIAYFKQGNILVESFLDSPVIYVKILTMSTIKYSGELSPYLSRIPYSSNTSTWLMVKLTSLINLFSFNCFYPTSLFFGLWSFLGSWKLIQLFTPIYKNNYHIICIAILFIPSCIFWSSGIIKESVTTGAIGFFIFHFYKLTITKKINAISIITLIICFSIVKVIKGATIYVLFPCLSLWLLIIYFNKISALLKTILTTLIILSLPLSIYLLVPKMEKYVEGNDEFVEAQSTISGFQSDHGGEWREMRGGHGGGKASTYHLSTAGDLSLLGMLKSFPEAVSYTLFRPFPWETTKIVQLLGSFESFTFLVITILLMLKIGPLKIIRQTYKDPNLAFVLSYALFFGFIAGYISFNYGVLQRFKTPMMPFYTLFLAIHYNYYKRKLAKKR